MVVKDSVTVTVEKRGYNVVVTVTTMKRDRPVATNLQIEAKRMILDDKYSEPREQTVYDSKGGVWPSDEPGKGIDETQSVVVRDTKPERLTDEPDNQTDMEAWRRRQ